MTTVNDQVPAEWTNRDAAILAMVTARCWSDALYRAEVFANPRAVLAEEGVFLLGEFELRAVDSVVQVDPDAGPDVRYVVLPAAPPGTDLTSSTEAELLRQAALVRPMVIDPRNHEVKSDVTTATSNVVAEVEAVTAVVTAAELAVSVVATAVSAVTIVAT